MLSSGWALRVGRWYLVGQWINLVQVMGNASISGHVNIDLYFHTPDGPIKINVKAYVVKGMSTPLILGIILWTIIQYW